VAVAKDDAKETLAALHRTSQEKEDAMALVTKLKNELATTGEKFEKSQSKIMQLKVAFEETAKRAAADKAIKEKAVESGKEAASLISSMRKEIKKLRHDKENYITVNEGKMSSKNAEMESKLAETTKTLEIELKKTSMLQTVLEEVQEKQNTVNVGVRVKDSTIEQQQKEIDRMNMVIENMNRDAVMYKDDLSRIRGERAAVEEELEEREGIIEEKDGIIEEKERELGELRDKLEEQEINAATASAATEATKENEDLREVLESKDEALRYIELELASLKSVFAEKESGLKETFSSEMKALRERVDLERSGWNSDSEEKERRITKERLKYEECKKVSLKLKKRLEAMMALVEEERLERKKVEDEVKLCKDMLVVEKEKTRVAATKLFNELTS
jgi:hypothetical protein